MTRVVERPVQRDAHPTVDGPMNESPHVRAIASRPDQTRPLQSPGRAEPNITHSTSGTENGKHRVLPSVPASRARAEIPQRGNRYTAELATETRWLRFAGWQPAEIQRIFERRGVRPIPSLPTIKYWLKGRRDYENQLESQRRYAARVKAEQSGGRLRGKPRTPEFKAVRLRALSELGLSCAAIAKVMTFDLGDPLTEDQVRYALKTGRYPRRAL